MIESDDQEDAEEGFDQNSEAMLKLQSELATDLLNYTRELFSGRPGFVACKSATLAFVGFICYMQQFRDSDSVSLKEFEALMTPSTLTRFGMDVLEHAEEVIWRRIELNRTRN